MLTTSVQPTIMPDMTDWLSVEEAAEKSGYHPEYLRRLLRKNTKLAKTGYVPFFEAVKKASVWLIEPKSFDTYCQKMNEMGTGKHDPTRKPKRK